MPSSRGSSWPRDQTWVSCITSRFFTVYATRDTLSTYIYQVNEYLLIIDTLWVLDGSDGKESACSAWDPGLIPGLGRSPGGRHGNQLQYSCLENSVDRRAWQATVHRNAKNITEATLLMDKWWQRVDPEPLSLVVVQLLSCVQLFAIPWTAARQAPLSFSISWGLPKLMSIELVMPSNYLILCCLLLLLFYLNFSQHQGLFHWVHSLHQVAKILELLLQQQSFQWTFRVDFP